jgi:hypothetical protein
MMQGNPLFLFERGSLSTTRVHIEHEALVMLQPIRRLGPFSSLESTGFLAQMACNLLIGKAWLPIESLRIADCIS